MIEKIINLAFDAPVEVVVARDYFYDLPISLDEFPKLINAIERRRREFAAGRACAQIAIQKLGHKNMSIPIKKDGLPLWPPLTVGSITHCPNFCCAVVSDSRNMMSVGIDAEIRGAVGADIEDLISARDERSKWPSTGISRSDTRSICFVAKEAFYKAYYPITSKFLDFHDVNVTIYGGTSKGKFTVGFREADALDAIICRKMEGFWIIHEENVYSGVSVKHP